MPRDPLQNPSINFMNRVPTGEITVVFPGAGHHRRHQSSSLPLDGRFDLATFSPSFSSPLLTISITAVSARFFRRFNLLSESPSTPKNHFHASKWPEQTRDISSIALSPVSIPTIFGDGTTTVGCARGMSIFLFLDAPTEEPPFAADAIHQPPVPPQPAPAAAAPFLSIEPMTAQDVGVLDCSYYPTEGGEGSE